MAGIECNADLQKTTALMSTNANSPPGRTNNFDISGEPRSEVTVPGAAADAAVNPGHPLSAWYNELRELARRYLSHQRRDHTLQPTALVHEAYLRLARH